MLIKTVEKCIQATLQKLTKVIPSEIRFGRYIPDHDTNPMSTL